MRFVSLISRIYIRITEGFKHFRQLVKKRGLQISRLGAFCSPKIIGAEGQSRTDTGSPPPVFEFDALCTNQFHHETYSMIGSLVVLAGMVCLIKGVGQTS
jgi:hypothetical protein